MEAVEMIQVVVERRSHEDGSHSSPLHFDSFDCDHTVDTVVASNEPRSQSASMATRVRMVTDPLEVNCHGR